MLCKAVAAADEPHHYAEPARGPAVALTPTPRARWAAMYYGWIADLYAEGRSPEP